MQKAFLHVLYCLQCFSSKDVLTNHKANYMVINSEQAIKMPDKGNNILTFQNFHKQMPVLFQFRLSQKKYKAVYQIIPNHTQTHTKNTLIVVMVIRLFAL